MKKNGSAVITAVIVVAVIFFLALLVIGFFAGNYNALVSSDENVNKLWGNVQTAYQRRADLIPNLVETVKGARDFEQETLTEIARLRSQAGQAQISIKNAEDVAQLERANEQMNSVLSRLLVIIEKYPDLKTNENFLQLQAQIEGTENRIKWERDNYNEGVEKYRVMTRRFPTNFVAGMFGFSSDKWKMFEAAPGSEIAPTVDFS